MHLHLDPIGGIAGDMFVSALIDAKPEFGDYVEEQLGRLAVTPAIRFDCTPYSDGRLTGRRFRVVETTAERADRPDAPDGHPHVHFSSIRRLLDESPLDPDVRETAQEIFALLAGAEATVHGVPIDRVTLHEAGNRDSIADIVAAATLIAGVGVGSSSVSSLPLGGGRIDGSHGPLPVPPPAVATLLQGFAFYDDGRFGERVTPTGAAILKALNPTRHSGDQELTLAASGTGFGMMTLEGMSNVLRVLLLSASERRSPSVTNDRVVVLSFEVDDQSSEDLAIGLDRIRATDGVLDVTQHPAIGKKGRLAMSVQLLARPEALERAIDSCFHETTTLGVRHQIVERAVLTRREARVDIAGAEIAVKVAQRPSGATTAKAEIADLSAHGDGVADRAGLRRLAEDQAIGGKTK